MKMTPSGRCLIIIILENIKEKGHYSRYVISYVMVIPVSSAYVDIVTLLHVKEKGLTF